MRTSLLLLLLLTGCRVGGGTFAGDLGGIFFDPLGTTFSYIDSHDPGGALRDVPELVVVSTWVAVDVHSDLARLPGDRIAAIRHEATLRDAIAFRTPAEDFAFGQTIENDNSADDNNLDVRLHLQAQELDDESTFAGFRPFGSLRAVALTNRQENATDFVGDAILTIRTAEDDAENARTGRVEGNLNAPQLSEALAEHNIAVLGLDTLLGLTP